MGPIAKNTSGKDSARLRTPTESEYEELFALCLRSKLRSQTKKKMLMLILCLLLALGVILMGSPGWKNPPVGVGMLLAAVAAVGFIYAMLGRGCKRPRGGPW